MTDTERLYLQLTEAKREAETLREELATEKQRHLTFIAEHNFDALTALRSELAEAKAALEKARETGAVLRQRAAELNLSMERWRLLGAVVSVSEDHVRQEAVGAAIDAWDALATHPGPESREQANPPVRGVDAPRICPCGSTCSKHHRIGPRDGLHYTDCGNRCSQPAPSGSIPPAGAEVDDEDTIREAGGDPDAIRSRGRVLGAEFMAKRIERLVDRFLMWKVPTTCRPDGIDGDPNRIGTNLLSASEAQQMFEYVLDTHAAPPPPPAPSVPQRGGYATQDPAAPTSAEPGRAEGEPGPFVCGLSGCYNTKPHVHLTDTSMGSASVYAPDLAARLSKLESAALSVEEVAAVRANDARRDLIDAANALLRFEGQHMDLDGGLTCGNHCRCGYIDAKLRWLHLSAGPAAPVPEKAAPTQLSGAEVAALRAIVQHYAETPDDSFDGSPIGPMILACRAAVSAARAAGKGEPK